MTTSKFEQLARIFVLGIWPFYALAVAAVFVVRRRPAESAVSLGVLLLGVPAYSGWRALQGRRIRRDQADR